MDPHSMGMQGTMSMPMSKSGGGNPQAMAMGGMSAMYTQQQPQMLMTQQMPMGSMTQMNPNPNGGADWRIQLTREHRANLIAKIYNEMVRVSSDPVPGIKLWMNVSWYELSLYNESPTQEVYINKIFTRLKSLRAQQSDMNAAMAAQSLPNQGMLSRLDFSYYNTLSLSQRGANTGQVGSYPGQSQQFGGPGPHPGTQQQQQQGKSVTPVKTETSLASNLVDEYWRQHAALRAKHQGDVEKVHSAFKKYVDHMKGHDETEQKKKLRYLLSYVELCANILGEDKATHPPRKIEELDKVFKYIVKIVNPYLKKLRTETDKRSYPSGDSSSSSTGAGGQPNASVAPGAPTPSGAPTSSGSSTVMASTSSGLTTQPRNAGQTQQQSAPNAQNQQPPQQKQQQQYILQQRAQHMQQQQHQRMRQQQMVQQQQQQQMMQQQQMQQKAPQQQTQFPAQQANQVKQQQNSQNAANQQSGQQTQQPGRSQQTAAQQPQKPLQSQQNQQAPPSRGESPTGLTIGLDDTLYGSMGNDLLQMPTPSGTSSGLMDFSSALSPTSFGGMDLLDWDDGTPGQGTSGQTNAGGDSSDLMTFVETL